MIPLRIRVTNVHIKAKLKYHSAEFVHMDIPLLLAWTQTFHFFRKDCSRVRLVWMWAWIICIITYYMKIWMLFEVWNYWSSAMTWVFIYLLNITGGSVFSILFSNVFKIINQNVINHKKRTFTIDLSRDSTIKCLEINRTSY